MTCMVCNAHCTYRLAIRTVEQPVDQPGRKNYNLVGYYIFIYGNTPVNELERNYPNKQKSLEADLNLWVLNL